MTFANARTALAPFVDNGVNSTEHTRIDTKLDEAQRRLIDQYNFFVRREQLEKPALVWTAGGTTTTTTGGGTPPPANLILDNFDATKIMVLALWREENNELEMASALEKKALDMIERDLIQEIETERRNDFQDLETNNAFNTLGHLTGRIGLETVTRYRLSKTRIQSYIRSAYRTAVDHYNFIVRREALELERINNPALPGDSSVLAISPEIIREIVLNQMAQDQA